MNVKNLKTLFSDAIPIIKRVAPSIGSVIGGPVGMATGFILPILANAFDSSPMDMKNLVNKIINDPDSEDKLKKVEEEYGVWVSSALTNFQDLSKASIHIDLEFEPNATSMANLKE